MATRKLQIYLSEEEYLFLKQAAGEGGSMAGVVRRLIDGAWRPAEPLDDPFYSHVRSRRPGSGKPYHAAQAKRDLYQQPR
jgi:hypothetical protein